jgi:hypothetical protein
VITLQIPLQTRSFSHIMKPWPIRRPKAPSEIANVVALGNSDPAVVRVADLWLRRLSAKRRFYSIQHHADQDIEELRAFWASELGTDPFVIRFQRKSNSGRLAHRRWRSEHGVLTVGVNDTYLRARLQRGWI